jgi:hypothetical protein
MKNTVLNFALFQVLSGVVAFAQAPAGGRGPQPPVEIDKSSPVEDNSRIQLIAAAASH